jgi:Ca2+-binding RTX toxin-like protein
VTGGSGNDILVGDANVNALVGGAGLNILIGEGGVDQLVGGAGNDLLIGGSLSYDSQAQAQTALAMIMAEWANPLEPYQQRVYHLQYGGGQNGSYVINSSTVTYGGGSDVLTGNGGMDWKIY